MTLTGQQPPCAFPPHPGGDDVEDLDPQLPAGESALSRLSRWVQHAPAERAPAVAAPVVWPAAEIMHAVGVSGVYPGAGTVIAAALAGWAAERRAARSEHPRLAAAEVAAATAAIGGWVTAADVLGPLAGRPPWLTLAYLTGSAGGYWWLRTHKAVRAARARRDQAAAQAAAWREKKAWWHSVAHRIGLGRFHLQAASPTLLGEELLVVTSPDGDLASRIAANSSAIAERLAHLLGLPYGRIDITATDYPGQLLIGIRTVDVSTREAAYHPMTTPWPDAEPSPFASWFPETASIRQPAIWGFCPEDGSALSVELISKIGGRVIGVFGMTGSGKSNLLNNLREFITRCPDGRLVQLNGAHMGDELSWEPLSALTVCGPVATDEQVRDKIGAALSALCLFVTQRSESLARTGHSTFQPTPEAPAVTVIIDEVDEIVAHVPGAGQMLEFLASKQRKSAVALVLATQRAVVKTIGGGGVRANMSESLVGVVARASESRHASGAEKELPDIRAYSRGAPGYFQVWDPRSGAVTGRGRAFLLGVPPEELACIQRLVAARAGLRDWSIPDLPPLVLDDPGERQDHSSGNSAPGAPGADDMRARIAAARSEVTGNTPGNAVPGGVPGTTSPGNGPGDPRMTGGVPAGTAHPVIPGVPPRAVAVLIPLLAAGRTSAAAAALPLGVSKTVAYEYLSAMREYGFAELTGGGRSAGWQLPRHPEVPEDKREHVENVTALRRYTTLADLAEAVHDGQVDADDDARTLLEKVRRIAARKRLTVLPGDEE
jgi:S-DNA-T family DNA segregation ATPase FtsK/SpoIIIE